MNAQTRLGSLAEAAQNILVGYAISVAATYLIGPFFHMRPSVGDVLGFGLAMTAISIARTYGIRRWNEFRRGHNTPPDFQHIMEDVAVERRRQIGGEGFTLAHDDEHVDFALAKAASCYAYAASLTLDERRRIFDGFAQFMSKRLWPAGWSMSWFKPTHRRRDLIKAAALIVAEIGRLDRVNRRDGFKASDWRA